MGVVNPQLIYPTDNLTNINAASHNFHMEVFNPLAYGLVTEFKLSHRPHLHVYVDCSHVWSLINRNHTVVVTTLVHVLVV